MINKNINEQIKHLKEVIKEHDNRLMECDSHLELHKQLQWLEQLKEYLEKRIECLEVSYSNSKNDEYYNAKLLGEVKGLKYLLGKEEKEI